MVVKIDTEKLKQCREERDLTQDELALLAKVSRPTISKLENGYTGINLDNIIQVARALRIKVADIVIG